MAIPTALRMASALAWAVTPEYLDVIESIAAGLTDPVAVSTSLGKPLENTRTVEIRDGIAIIPVHSVIFRYASMFDSISGDSASVQTIAKDFFMALKNPQVHTIVFDFDSPGGEAKGIAELAAIIYAARGVKPIKAYVGDLAASAAYWLCVACDEVIVHRTARVGSIGVMTIADVSKNPNKKRFTSTQSPNKNPPADSSKGEALIQMEIDTLAVMFIDDVAKMRGVSVETVLADFGQGGILYADDAINVGMADRLGSFEELLKELQQDGVQTAASMTAVVNRQVMAAFSTSAMTALLGNQIKIKEITDYD